MPLTEIGEGFVFGGKLLDVVNDIMDRRDRDEIQNDLYKDNNEIQNSFSKPDDKGGLDDQYRAMYRLFTIVGHAPTPTGNVGGEATRFAEREFRHNALIIASELRAAQRIISRLVAQRKGE